MLEIGGFRFSFYIPIDKPTVMDTALLVYGGKYAARVIEAAEHISVKDIDVVEHKGVYGDYDGDKRKHHSLKLISRHIFPPKTK